MRQRPFRNTPHGLLLQSRYLYPVCKTPDNCQCFAAGFPLSQEWAIPFGTAHSLTLQNPTASQLRCLHTPDFVVVVSGENKYFVALLLVFLRILHIM